MGARGYGRGDRFLPFSSGPQSSSIRLRLLWYVSMLTSHTTLKLFRKIHLYIGVFIAPALLFFAFTGAVQTLSLHETTQGSSYKPPAWLAKLGQLHKKQTLVVPIRKPKSASPDKPTIDTPKADRLKGSSASNPAQASKLPDVSAPGPNAHLPMKIFFLLVSIGLFISTLTGIYMVYKYNRSKLVVTSLLFAGIVVPLLLLLF
jgi:hypothetical protein